MATRSYYEILEIEETATDSEIKRAYRKLAMKYHPDKNPAGAEMFKEISHAYETLSDPSKRAAYDQFGDGDLPEDMFGGFGMGDGFFGESMFTGGPPPPPKVEIHPLEVTLEDLFRGKKLRLKLVRSTICKQCKGVGGKKAALHECYACNGKGVRLSARQVAPGLFSQTQVGCTVCNRTGKVVPDSKKCKRCKGRGVTDEKDTVEISIEPGMSDGQRIVLAGKGDQKPGQDPLDLVFVLRQIPHSKFTRLGDSLSVKAQIDLAEALCGFSRVLLTHLDGHPLEVSHKSGVLKPGDVLRISCEGMPQEKRPRSRGDLYIVLDIKFPDSKWKPGSALTELLPQTVWPTPSSSTGAPAKVAAGRPISEDEYTARMREQSRNAHHADQGHEYQDAGSGCQQQ
ncbi:DnaJ-like protein xdj1 [Coemansia sp. RSA 2706]|nr:DnaJ-like protein xdj1 [Coemansia sp. RSA 2706]KAJ2718082.1 DnaJ-like protein xdj1 [Coemansia sp. Cherry 401B]